MPPKKKEDDLKILVWRSATNKKELCIYVVRRSAVSMGVMDSVPFPSKPGLADYQAVQARMEELKKEVLKMKGAKDASRA